MFEFIEQELNELKKAGLFRELRTIEKANGSRIIIGGKEHINFCSNNYLGLAQHPKVIEKAIEIIRAFGFGAGASRLISGNTIIHEELERKIAKFKNREAAIVFPSGYMANLGAITSLVDENDTVIIDRLNHASIIDACRLSKAKMQVYPHKDLISLEIILQRSEKYRRRLIITDSVFSMDGDIAPVKDIVELGKKYNALTMTDDAHATGVLEYEGRPDIVMGTLSKAVGSLGGFISGSYKLIDYLRNKARSFIYTTALPPAACAAAIAALEIIENEPELSRNLRMNSQLLREKISRINSTDLHAGAENLFSGPEAPIIPILIGDADRTMKISQQLFERGFFVSGIRPPTVPRGESRLRVTVTANHTTEDLDAFTKTLLVILRNQPKCF
jgi:glycine C-acetyltransferase/8-amino-7-oxononanoate synthase